MEAEQIKLLQIDVGKILYSSPDPNRAENNAVDFVLRTIHSNYSHENINSKVADQILLDLCPVIGGFAQISIEVYKNICISIHVVTRNGTRSIGHVARI